MDLPVFVEFFQGLAAANAKIFGDLGKELGRAVQGKAEELLGTTINVEAKDDVVNKDQPTDG